MKIGLTGNMNNKNFAMMRYFRDLATDAHLFLDSNDGRGTLSYFAPEANSWQMERWAPFIHQNDIPNAPIVAFNYPLSIVVEPWYYIKRKTDVVEYSTGALTWGQIRHAYCGYE